MILIGLTQRVDTSPFGERRDALDQAWTRFIHALGAEPIPLPNLSAIKGIEISAIAKWLEVYPVDAVVLTGGNTPLFRGYSGPVSDIAHERDSLESFLLRQLPNQGIPVVGVCRGLQMINIFYGGTLAKVSEHIACRHRLCRTSDSPLLPLETNSYHNYAVMHKDLAPCLKALSWSDDGVIEALRHKTKPVAAVMWHPERETPFVDEDLVCFRKWLGIE